MTNEPNAKPNFTDFLKPEGFAEIRKDPKKMEFIQLVSKRLASDPDFLAHVERVLSENSEGLKPMENAVLELSSFGYENQDAQLSGASVWTVPCVL
jgi:hypothetical protein